MHEHRFDILLRMMQVNDSLNLNSDLHADALYCLQLCDPAEKVAATSKVYEYWQNATQLPSTNSTAAISIPEPGRPQKPELVAPRNLPHRSPTTTQGRAALIHALAHIEFNAINLALDAAYRFRQLPLAYYQDWLKVASEEAHHFDLLNTHLQQMGYRYGDFAAHNGLWEMALKTDYDVLVRMALVPRVMEARGLDVTPMIMRKLEQAGDTEAMQILAVIQRDEVGHVEIGNRWYRYFCEQRQLLPLDTFKKLLAEHLQSGVRGPYDIAMRKLAGFTEEELDYLQQVDAR